MELHVLLGHITKACGDARGGAGLAMLKAPSQKHKLGITYISTPFAALLNQVWRHQVLQCTRALPYACMHAHTCKCTPRRESREAACQTPGLNAPLQPIAAL